MVAMKRFETVDHYIASATQWQDELRQLREVLLSTGLTEEVKWGAPCYTHRGKNVVGMSGFKSYFGLWYHQGALLKDDKKVLMNAQEGKTRALRQWRMSAATDIKPSIIKRYITESVQYLDAGKEIKAERNKPIIVPPHLQAAFEAHSGAQQAYSKLRPGLQREYADYVADAKREDTKLKRIDKILPMILEGVGLNDKYR